MAFSIAIYGKFNSNFPLLFYFFCLVYKLFKSLFYLLVFGQQVVWVESLNYATYLDMSRNLSIIYIWTLLVLPFKESPMPLLCILLMLFLVCKLWTFGLQVIPLILVHLTFIDIVSYLVVWNLEMSVLILNCFISCFSLLCRLHKSRPYTITYFGHGKCFMWGFLVLVFSLTTIYLF